MNQVKITQNELVYLFAEFYSNNKHNQQLNQLTDFLLYECLSA